MKKLFALIKELRSNKKQKLQRHMHTIDPSDADETSNDDSNEEADKGDDELEESPSESDFEDESEVKKKNRVLDQVETRPSRQRKSSGSGRSMDRMKMDIVQQEIKELEEKLKFLVKPLRIRF